MAYVKYTLSFDLETTFDFLSISTTAGVLKRYTGTGSDVTLTVPVGSDGYSKVAFETDNKGRRSGFTATWAATNSICTTDADCIQGTCDT